MPLLTRRATCTAGGKPPYEVFRAKRRPATLLQQKNRPIEAARRVTIRKFPLVIHYIWLNQTEVERHVF
jgi:hypothetical protein